MGRVGRKNNKADVKPSFDYEGTFSICRLVYLGTIKQKLNREVKWG